MVDLSLLQSVSYMAGALGVFLGAVYYINNMRYTLKTREIDLCRMAISEMTSESGVDCYNTAISMNWESPEDFQEKYGPGKPEDSRWVSQFLKYETLAYLIKKKLAKPETIYDLGFNGVIQFWDKFKDVIEARRKVIGRDTFSNTEFLAGEMLRIRMQRDPSYKTENHVKFLKIK
jgi:hypothetical protein